MAAITDAVDGDCFVGFLEENAMVADAQAEESIELSTERLGLTQPTPVRLAMNGFQDVEGGFLLDGADLSLYVRPEADLLQASSGDFADLVLRRAPTDNS